MSIGPVVTDSVLLEIVPQAFPSVPRRFAPRNDIVGSASNSSSNWSWLNYSSLSSKPKNHKQPHTIQL